MELLFYDQNLLYFHPYPPFALFLACGACSSMQDLAVYIETPNLQSAGQICGVDALSNVTEALECYMNVGFSRSCAAAWLYDTTNTRIHCLNVCFQYLGKPPNKDEPNCPLNDCIMCDEVYSGPIFKKIAGRTRRDSGLVSFIIRNCSEIVYDVAPVDPCPAGYWEHNSTGSISSVADRLRPSIISAAATAILTLFVLSTSCAAYD